MKSCRPPLFRKRKFAPEVIVSCVRWYFRFCLSLRDLEELMAERGLAVDHTTIWRWVQHYGPEVLQRLKGQMKRKSSTWHMDETFVRIAGKQKYRLCCICGGMGVRADLSVRKRLCSTEQSLEQPGLPVQVVAVDPEYLPFPNHVRRLDSLDGRPRCRRRAWALHRSQPPLHVAVIGFDPVITIKARTLQTMLPHATLA